MSPELATPAPTPVEVNIDSPTSTGRFRRRIAMYCMLMNTALTAALLAREQDVGPNTMELLSWVIIANACAIVGAIGFKALETFGLLKGRRL